MTSKGAHQDCAILLIVMCTGVVQYSSFQSSFWTSVVVTLNV